MLARASAVAHGYSLDSGNPGVRLRSSERSGSLVVSLRAVTAGLRSISGRFAQRRDGQTAPPGPLSRLDTPMAGDCRTIMPSFGDRVRRPPRFSSLGALPPTQISDRDATRPDIRNQFVDARRVCCDVPARSAVRV